MNSVVLLALVAAVFLAEGALGFRTLPVHRRPISSRFMATSADSAVPKMPVDHKVLSKSDVVAILQEKTQFVKDDIAKVVNTLIEVIHDEVFRGGNEIRMRDFGTFKVRNRSPRNARNPKTGEAIKVCGKRSLGFSAASAFKEDVSHPTV